MGDSGITGKYPISYPGPGPVYYPTWVDGGNVGSNTVWQGVTTTAIGSPSFIVNQNNTESNYVSASSLLSNV